MAELASVTIGGSWYWVVFTIIRQFRRACAPTSAHSEQALFFVLLPLLDRSDLKCVVRYSKSRDVSKFIAPQII